MQQNVRATEEADRDAARLLDVLDKVNITQVLYALQMLIEDIGPWEMGQNPAGRFTVLDAPDSGICWE